MKAMGEAMARPRLHASLAAIRLMGKSVDYGVQRAEGRHRHESELLGNSRYPQRKRKIAESTGDIGCCWKSAQGPEMAVWSRRLHPVHVEISRNNEREHCCVPCRLRSARWSSLWPWSFRPGCWVVGGAEAQTEVVGPLALQAHVRCQQRLPQTERPSCQCALSLSLST